MKVSVIIPIHNNASTIEKTINAFLNQTVPCNLYEIVFVNDHSEDTSQDILNKYSERKNIKVYQNSQNMGPAYTRNTGIDQAIGDLLIFSDGDMVPCHNFIEEHMNFHGKYSGKEYVVLGNVEYPPNLRITPLMKLGNATETWEDIEKQEVYDYTYFRTGNISIKRDFLTVKFNSKIFSDIGFEDTELGYQLYKKGMIIVYNPKAISYHYHFRSPQQYLANIVRYGTSFAYWGAYAKDNDIYLKNVNVSHLAARSLMSIKGIKELLNRIAINKLTVPVILYSAKFLEKKNEELSFALYRKLHRYYFLKGYKYGRNKLDNVRVSGNKA